LGFTALGLEAAEVVFADASPVVGDVIQRIITINALETRATMVAMSWGIAPPQGPFAVILGGDLLYRSAFFSQLSLSIKLGLAEQGCCLLSDPRRRLDADLPRIFADVGLSFVESRRNDYTLIRCEHQ
jgi:predicted nicotinamide N-methyase